MYSINPVGDEVIWRSLEMYHWFNKEQSKKVHSGNLTLQWKMDPLKMYFLLNMEKFQPAMLVKPRG